MKKILSDIEVNFPDGFDCILKSQKNEGDISFYTFKMIFCPEKVDKTTEFIFNFSEPMNDYMYYWSPFCRSSRSIGPNWKNFDRSFASWCAPVHCIFDGRGNNRFTYALDECAKLVNLKCGTHEKTGKISVVFTIPIMQYTGKTEAEFTLRTDKRYIPMYEAVSGVAEWWENECGMKPAFVPEIAKDPIYSFWYSYHQSITDKSIEEECKRAKKLGLDACIVDLGWETDSNNAGFAYTGDWEVSKVKIPDMKAHVQRVHDIGMKYVLWFGMPMIGFKSERFSQFENMIVRRDERHTCGILDPRYKEVRDYLIGTFVKAVTEWGIDGLKLDFVDSWNAAPSDPPYNEKMDIEALSDAVDKLMTDVMMTLKEIKPDILIEFRQNYIGPNMRKYGNMFRVGDCPNDYISNRVGVLDLRMLLRDSAVHSDMLMWHPDEKPETAALQIISVIFGTVQYSARLESMPEETRTMSSFWLSVAKEHKNLLLNSKLSVTEPHLLYTSAMSETDDECFVAVYAIDKLICPKDRNTVYIANGVQSERVLADLNGTYNVTVVNCMGKTVFEGTKNFNGITPLDIPVGGLATLTK